MNAKEKRGIASLNVANAARTVVTRATAGLKIKPVGFYHLLHFFGRNLEALQALRLADVIKLHVAAKTGCFRRIVSSAASRTNV